MDLCQRKRESKVPSATSAVPQGYKYAGFAETKSYVVWTYYRGEAV